MRVEAFQVEDVAGGGRVAEPLADVLDAVSGRRDRGAVRGLLFLAWVRGR
jgi:hypothetical protein